MLNTFHRVALQIPPMRRLYESRQQLSAAIDVLMDEKADLVAQSEQQQQELANWRSPFSHYTAVFDPRDLVQRHAAIGLKPTPGYFTNFLGVLIDPKFFPSILDEKAGEIEKPPQVCNWHACVAEWGATLRAVEYAGPTFTMIELGCGWGCWMNNTGVAAKRLGKKVHLIGVEGDESHIGFARESLATNGFATDEYTLHRGVAAGRSGTALFPRQDQGGAHWGLEPIFGATDEQRAEALRTGRFDALPMISLAELVAGHDRIDLLHIDIQGGEVEFIRNCLPLINEKVAYMFIGTHSRQIDGALFDLLLGAGWLLEIERPALIRIEHGQAAVHSDGVQGWKNSRPVAGR